MKIACLAAAIAVMAAGWLGYSYYDFQIKFNEQISFRDFNSAKSTVARWEKNKAAWLLENLNRIKQDLAFKKGWLAAMTGDDEEAMKEFRKAAGYDSPLKAEAIYNAATLGLWSGRESLEKLAEDYIRALKENSDDFQTKVNLEIIRIIQNQQKQETPTPAPGQSKKGEKSKIKQFQMKDKEGQGQESGDSDQGIRY